MTNEIEIRKNSDLVGGVRQAITPTVWAMLSEIAQSSTVSQVDRAKIIKKMLFCYENDLPLSLAVSGGLYEVNGRMEVEGTVIRAQIRKHPNYDYAITRLDDKGCELTIFYNGDALGTASFTIDDAKRVIINKQGDKLSDKDNYRNYPADMFLNRATSRAYKRFCPDIFFQSVYVRGELANEYQVVEQTTIQSLTDQHGHDKVLEAMQATSGDIDAMAIWLEENSDD